MMSASLRHLPMGPAWRILYEPLAKRISDPRLFLPRLGRHNDEWLPGTDALRSLFLGHAQHLGLTGLGLGEDACSTSDYRKHP